MDGNTVNVNIHFHFQNSSSPLICLYFYGSSGGGDMYYVGGSANVDLQKTRDIMDTAFGVSTVKGTNSHAGKWVKQ